MLTTQVGLSDQVYKVSEATTAATCSNLVKGAPKVGRAHSILTSN